MKGTTRVKLRVKVLGQVFKGIGTRDLGYGYRKVWYGRK
jgi:hypothetical protein